MIRFDNVFFGYNHQPVLKKLDFSIAAGEFVGLIGPNGAGKSTLLKLINRLIIPTSGHITLRSKALRSYFPRELARLIGYVQQDFSTSFNYTALDIVLMGRFPHQKALAFDSAEDVRIALQAMQITDCHYLKDRDFHSLSGGEKQRVVLASALAQEPQILLLDEPTSALDLKHQIQFYQILLKLKQERNMTILTVTHDINLAAQFCKRIIILKEGVIVADGLTGEIMQQEVLQHTYEIPIRIMSHPANDLPLIFPEFK